MNNVERTQEKDGFSIDVVSVARWRVSLSQQRKKS